MGILSYDANGNLTHDTSHAYSWDADGKNTQMDGTSAMTYDALGRVVEKASGGSFVETVYGFGGEPFATMFAQRFVEAHVLLSGGAVAEYGDPQFQSSTIYWHPDWLGTARVFSFTTRALQADIAIAPYGEQYIGPGTDYFFTGVAPTEVTKDVLNFPTRGYERIEGRWLTPDPAGLAAVDLTNPQSFNRYAYVLGNPLGNVDPTGMSYVPCKYPGSIACVGNDPAGKDPDFATTADPYQANNALYMEWLNSNQFLNTPSDCKNCGGNQGNGNSTQTSPNSGMPPPPPAPPKGCEEQLSDIYDAVNGVRGPGSSRFKGLAQRHNQIGRMSMGARPGHIDQFLNRQHQLQRMINNYRNSGCGEPPSDVMDWATRPAPDGQVRPWAKYVMIGGAVVIVGATAILAPEALPVLIPALVP